MINKAMTVVGYVTVGTFAAVTIAARLGLIPND